MKKMVGLVVGCMAIVSAAAAEMRDLEGSVGYRERIAMPEGALVEVSLQDISLADAPSQELATVVIRPEGQVPVDYRMAYDSAMVRSGHRYAVQAKIIVDGQVAWRTTQVFAALTEDAPERVDVMLEKAAGMVKNSVPDALTLGSYLVVAIDGVEVQGSPVPEMEFGADGRVSGSSGCNRFNGSVTVDGSALSFGPLASTRMACPAPLDAQERAFFGALERVAGFDVEGGVALVDGAGNEVIRLMAQ
ncbi:YbaY family lipoprotein [Shimia haliotis]|uniref:Putative lipoprotein n=1 Tax=Shimia haliotis TaxID=1280847 RepID=A0A1I4GYP7_9RHOB|nr:YbaY family lipoprotein [Shimia haliotis]SFL35192.1 putative lipoprotein [Shimia haliotis]